MKHMNTTMRRLCLYIVGLFFLSTGISFSIQADLGVSPVSSLAYAITLVTGISVGAMLVATNILYIMIQVILSKKFSLKDAIVQLTVVFIFGFFTDLTLFLLQFLPAPETLGMRWIYLGISLIAVPIGLLGYFNAKFTLMAYDELTHVISERFNIDVSRAKVSSDLLNVTASALIGLIFIQSFGSVGIGTFISAYLTGKILGWFIKHFQKPIINWTYQEDVVSKKEKDKPENPSPVTKTI